MKKEETIKGVRRTETGSGANKRLRRDGFLPGNIFGKGMDTVQVAVRRDEVMKGLAKHGKAAVFRLEVEGDKTYDVMVREIQNLPTKGGVQHVDFQRIILSEELKAEVPVKTVGTEFVETRHMYILHQIDVIPVRGLAKDLPEAVEIDVSHMQPGDTVTVGELKLPKGIVCDVDPESPVLSVKEAKKHDEAVEEAAEAPVAAAE